MGKDERRATLTGAIARREGGPATGLVATMKAPSQIGLRRSHPAGQEPEGSPGGDLPISRRDLRAEPRQEQGLRDARTGNPPRTALGGTAAPRMAPGPRG